MVQKDPDISTGTFASSILSMVKVIQNLISSVQDYLVNKFEATSKNYKAINWNLEYQIFFSENTIKIFAEKNWNQWGSPIHDSISTANFILLYLPKIIHYMPNNLKKEKICCSFFPLHALHEFRFSEGRSHSYLQYLYILH